MAVTIKSAREIELMRHSGRLLEEVHDALAEIVAPGITTWDIDKLVLRDDDKPEAVANRLKVYHDQTQPLIDYYKAKGILVSVDGTQDMDKVFADIKELLG